MGTNQNTAAIYIRRSAIDERDTGAFDNRSLNAQERECRELAERHGLEVTEVFAEKVGISASHLKNHKRPKLEQAMAAIGNTYQTLIIWALDRQTRKGMSEAGALLDRVEASNGRLLSVNDGIDSNDPSSRLIIALKAEMAREEIVKIQARVRRGKEEQRRRGEHQGGRRPYGWVKDLTAPYGVSLDPEAVSTIREAVDLVLKGKSLGYVCKTLNDSGRLTGYNTRWTTGTLSLVLRNPNLLGHRRQKGDVFRDEDGRPVQVTEPIISEADFLRVDKRLAERAVQVAHMTAAHKGSGMRLVAVLAALIRCDCGSSMTRSRMKAGASQTYYRCSSCNPGHNVNGPMVDAAVARTALSFLSALEPDSKIMEEVSRRWLHHFAPESVGRRDELVDELEVLEGRQRALQREFYEAGTMDEATYQGLNRTLSSRISDLRGQMVGMPEPDENLGALLDLAASADDDDPNADPVGPGSSWAALETETQREILRVLIEEIVVERRDTPRTDIDGRIKIKFVTESNVTEMAQRGVSNFRTTGLTQAA